MFTMQIKKELLILWSYKDYICVQVSLGDRKSHLSYFPPSRQPKKAREECWGAQACEKINDIVAPVSVSGNVLCRHMWRAIHFSVRVAVVHVSINIQSVSYLENSKIVWKMTFLLSFPKMSNLPKPTTTKAGLEMVGSGNLWHIRVNVASAPERKHYSSNIWSTYSVTSSWANICTLLFCSTAHILYILWHQAPINEHWYF